MAPPQEFQISQSPITAHAFNADRTQLAVSLNSTTVQIMSPKSQTEWAIQDTLTEHDKIITSIDWAPSTNRIVTASQDRNAYVWTPAADGSWKPTLVLLRINRAATAVRWSPKEDKFAVASGARAIAVCSFDPEADWWVSKLLKKPIRSTVLSLDWHPNNVILAAGSADMKARVFSAYIKDVDSRPKATVWGEKLPFNTVCGEYASPAGGWVHAVAFSPSGDVLAFAAHDSTISIVYPASGNRIFCLRSDNLPYLSISWASEGTFVAAGHDCLPVLFSGSESAGWSPIGSLDDVTAPKAQTASSARAGPVGRLNNAAFNAFRNADTRGAGGGAVSNNMDSPVSSASGGTEQMTIHQNTITELRPYSGNVGAVSHISTSGLDGKLVIWDVHTCSNGLASKFGGMALT